MEIKNYQKRIIDRKIEQYLKLFGAILIEGPKWCGKTWTSKNACNSEFLVASSSDNFNNKKLALTVPSLVLEGPYPRLIDEWQEVPSLWDAIRTKVDEEAKKGMFILTGSTSINKNSYIHSGTGRIAHLKMRTMSLFEAGYSKGEISLYDVCNNKAQNVLTGDISLNTIIELVLKGTFPALINLSTEQAQIVNKEYINSFLNEDIYKIDDIKRDKRKVELLLRSLARNESTCVTNSTLKKDIQEKDYNDINIDTITDYLNVFERLHLIEDIPPFSSNIRSSLRVKQSVKRHFVDPALPCAILNLTKEKLINDLNLLGFLFESLVERDLLTYVSAFNGKLYHYQNYNNEEIDAIIELENGSWCGVEIKLGANQIDEAAHNLIKINNKIINAGLKGAQALIVICGLTNASYMRNDGVYVLPITSLKD